MTDAAHADLPEILREIAALAGLDAALKVAEAVGGTRVYVPRRPGADHWLTRAVGADAAARIAEHLTTGQTGLHIEFPRGPQGSYNRERRARTRLLTDLAAQGLQPTEIARRAGITRRGAQMFKARLGQTKNPDQGDLDL